MDLPPTFVHVDKTPLLILTKIRYCPRPLIQGNFRNKFSRQNQGLPIIEQKKEDNKFFINAFHSSKSKNKSTIRGHKNSDFCLQLKERKDEKKHKKSREDRII
jgi:hypothetical protein